MALLLEILPILWAFAKHRFARVISGILHWGTHVAIAFGQPLQFYAHLQNLGYLEHSLNYPLVALHLLNNSISRVIWNIRFTGIAFGHPSHFMRIC